MMVAACAFVFPPIPARAWFTDRALKTSCPSLNPQMSDMVTKLGSLAKKRMIISFAPETWYYSILKKIGELFPGPSKTTRAYLHSEADVVKALKAAGFTIRRNDMTATSFYYSRLLEAVRE
jgi:magnesium-protoporphyrin O-methyltransferase